MIKITEEWYMSADETCVTLFNKKIIKTGKNKGTERFNAVGYYNNFKDALKAMVNKKIQGLHDLKKMVECLYKLERQIDNIVPDIVQKV